MNFFNALFSHLHDQSHQHQRKGDFHRIISDFCEQTIMQSSFASEVPASVEFGPFGTLFLPYYSMGNIDSLKLFGLDELILFSFYLSNKNHYKNVADMGANIGLHSILMSRLGWNVNAFEPDPVHVEKIHQHINLNSVSTITVKENAIADKNMPLTFTRLKGNRTGSHLKGKKSNVYGEIDEFTVNCVALSEVMSEFDFIKMDIEGAEADAICSTVKENWVNTDVMLEVGSEKNAENIFRHLRKLGVRLFSQKIGWQEVLHLKDMPFSYQDGSLFISSQKEFVWKKGN
ncbi:FkbM family methyltransferase [Aliiglaciecola sp. NS0011-25]|uniref:FkbM family methyltransferase n=1 Tax=Aliiglaciecola sp. NS0011-25 TaxID=3127654 RepID=UPI0031076170